MRMHFPACDLGEPGRKTEVGIAVFCVLRILSGDGAGVVFFLGKDGSSGLLMCALVWGWGWAWRCVRRRGTLFLVGFFVCVCVC